MPDKLTKVLYATDASVYRRLPMAVAFPKTLGDLKKLIGFARKHKIGLIPRTAGTSLAGQCVGEGIVVDVSKHFTQIIHLDQLKRQVTVQPGVIRDELNQFLEPYGLFFGPNTSTSNRCMIGGMVGNNSSGTTSIQYGVTRDKVVALKTLLSDGSEVAFKSLSNSEFEDKMNSDTLESFIYKNIYKELSDRNIQDEIRAEFPKPEIHRRNTGYAVDELLDNAVFGISFDGQYADGKSSDDKYPIGQYPDGKSSEAKSQEGKASERKHSDGRSPQRDFNLCNLLSGSEGTLAFTT
ncbi:MAG TPA: FAD-binding oxidoreductase, partial [Pricia sp.]|nr:FAD-binding oxidoreductase [Pricia sp.]